MGAGTDIIGDLHVDICGHGPPILLIHGFGASSFTWSKIVSSLAANHRVITVDLKGFGRSKKPRDGRYTLREQAAAVMNVIETLDLSEMILIGHSMGGGVALLLSMALEQEAPRRLRRLVLIDSIAYPQRLPHFVILLRLPLVGSLIMGLLPAAWLVRYVLSFAYFDRGKIEPAFVEEYAAPLRCRGGRAALIAAARAIIPPDINQLIEQYRTIRSPVLLLAGRQDRFVPLAIARRLAAAIPNADLKVLDQCGHVPHEEQPEFTMSILREILAISDADSRSAISVNLDTQGAGPH